MRAGIGYDVHRLAAGRDLILGGVKIPHSKGLLGHSDADCLTHAICDALLGSIGAGDIGQHFPDNDERFKGISSLKLLEVVVEMVEAKGYQINNIDATIVAEKPKLAPYISQMRERLANILKTAVEQVNIKATTTEGLGFIGHGEAVAAYAVVSIMKRGMVQKGPI
ncbi:MAG: 2-C-methyl-D-erythritol 2,4-cyclodiphosphate synthase [bacterium]|nr:2-C-methyl-D-erythritol 2,4-cyclodiphosphate synthase [bacterium]